MRPEAWRGHNSQLIPLNANHALHGRTTLVMKGSAVRVRARRLWDAAEEVFALGLLGAAFLGLGVVALTSSYATTEALGLERGLDLRPRQAPAFYGLLAFFLGAAAVLVLIPLACR
jgi:hypothetical protein